MNRTIIEDMPMRDYLALNDVSASDLKEAARSLRHFEVRQNCGGPSYSKAMEFGTLFHSFMEWSEVKFWRRHAIVPPSIDKRTKEYKAFKEENSGRTLVSMDEARMLEGMKASVLERYGDILYRPHRAEAVVLWRDPRFGVACKCRPDWWEIEDFDGESCIVDYKTTHDARAEPFANDAERFGYALSVPHYLEGTGSIEYRFLAIEKEPPYLCAMHVLPDDWVDSAARKRIELLEKIEESTRKREYAGYDLPYINTLERPRWSKP